MSSIIEGYNYDIFISYRQKDNKGDGWVSQFVEALKTELESTFKEEISVYFDINPHDGLLETYDVDESLKEKLKCLIFIPIISRTYCDPRAFAWEHEFKAFVERASVDQYGLKVKLPNGNVASRVLPVQIHDLKVDDKTLVENVLEGFLRPIDFIYSEAGVNRPLNVKDSEDKNLNRTNYRNQINKVANSIDEIISAIKTEPDRAEKEKYKAKESVKVARDYDEAIDQKQGARGKKNKFLIPMVVVVLLIIAGIITWPKIFRQDTIEKLRASGERISVAVMPFQNMTNDTTWNVWQNGVQNELITHLTNLKELRVRQTESVNSLIQDKGYTNYASISPTVARHISQKLDAKVFVYGSMKQSGNTIRLNAQLIDSRSEEVFKSFQIDGTIEKILPIVDSLSTMIGDFLIISIMEKDIIRDFRPLISTKSSEAYKYYMYGIQAFYKYDYQTASEWFRKAAAIDTTFTEAIRLLAASLGHQGLTEESGKWLQKNFEKRDQLSDMERLWAEISHTDMPDEKIKYYKLLIALDDEMPVPHSNLGYTYMGLNLWDKAIVELERELEIYKKWGAKPRWSLSYTELGKAYHKMGMFKKEGKLYDQAIKDFPDDLSIMRRQAILELSEGKGKAAGEYIERVKSILKENAASEAYITESLAFIYDEAGLPDKAEDYYRKTLSLDPDNPYRLNNLAWFLIDKDRNVQEGLDLIEKARELNISEYFYADCKGYGLLKLGEFEEALKYLERSDSLKSGYDHALFLHLEEARKAVAEQKMTGHK
jgi:TolB-like protein/Tfp pilus assembly protein PilF